MAPRPVTGRLKHVPGHVHVLRPPGAPEQYGVVRTGKRGQRLLNSQTTSATSNLELPLQSNVSRGSFSPVQAIWLKESTTLATSFPAVGVYVEPVGWLVHGDPVELV